jgi:hypothetical protein
LFFIVLDYVSQHLYPNTTLPETEYSIPTHDPQSIYILNTKEPDSTPTNINVGVHSLNVALNIVDLGDGVVGTRSAQLRTQRFRIKIGVRGIAFGA